MSTATVAKSTYMYDRFSNLYPLTKTLSFEMVPVGKTEQYIRERGFLERDFDRAQKAKIVKGYMDEYHKSFIEHVLSNKIDLSTMKEYSDLYYKKDKTPDEKKLMRRMEADMRNVISEAFKKETFFKDLFGAKLISEIIPPFLETQEEKDNIDIFRRFSGYFKDQFGHYKRLYVKEEKKTAIATRCINDNLPMFLDNIRTYEEKIAGKLPEKDLEEIDAECCKLLGFSLEYLFDPSQFPLFLCQSGIERYNTIIGGYTTSDGTKIQGLNEYINQYNTKHKDDRIPMLKQLFKQILSDRTPLSFVDEMITSDEEALKSILEYYEGDALHVKSFEEVKTKILDMVDHINAYDLEGVFVTSKSADTIANRLYGSWNGFRTAWYDEYKAAHPIGRKKEETYENTIRKAYNAIDSFSLARLQNLADTIQFVNKDGKNEVFSIVDWLKERFHAAANVIPDLYAEIEPLLKRGKPVKGKLATSETTVENILKFLEAVKEFECCANLLCGTGKEESKDETFYGEFVPYYNSLSEIDRLLNRIRNYFSKRPDSNDKIRMYFDNPSTLSGWDGSKERANLNIFLRKDDDCFVGFMDKSDTSLFVDPPYETGERYYEKLEYKQLQDPKKMLPKVFFAKKNIDYYAPSKEILDIYQSRSFKDSKDDLHKLIDFFKESISKNPDWDIFNFHFRPTDEYDNHEDFYKDVETQGYAVSFRKVSAKYVDDLVENGKFYLFRLYNRDFSDKKHGTPKLFTQYFRMLFSEENLKNIAYTLKGGATMFYRLPVIAEEDVFYHPANYPINNKNPQNPNRSSTYAYDIIKDRRYTRLQYSINFPVCMNFKANGTDDLNFLVRKALKENETPYVIGIDRGERNLIYICVIDGDGNIVEQRSLNEINSTNDYKVNYRRLLKERENDRKDSKRKCQPIASIKDLKEGYVSQVLHIVSELMVKYNAIVALENLNAGFMRSRETKMEGACYKKFENMLVNKLSFLVSNRDLCNAKDMGGLLNAYQLAQNTSDQAKGAQNGMVFFVSPWDTSNIDPVTGFVDLLKVQYNAPKNFKGFFGAFDSIVYNESDDLFEFTFDYSKKAFKRTDADARKKWTVCSFGDRIKHSDDREKDNKVIHLTTEFKRLFDAYSIDIYHDLQKQIVNNTDKHFQKQFIFLVNMMLHMRNSYSESADVDYIISPVRGADGCFYCSNDYKNDVHAKLPGDADANGAYNIARKGLMLIKKIKKIPNDVLKDEKLFISNDEWLAEAQKV